jgi:hypothetical protein
LPVVIGPFFRPKFNRETATALQPTGSKPELLDDAAVNLEPTADPSLQGDCEALRFVGFIVERDPQFLLSGPDHDPASNQSEQSETGYCEREYVQQHGEKVALGHELSDSSQPCGHWQEQGCNRFELSSDANRVDVAQRESHNIAAVAVEALQFATVHAKPRF